MTLEEWHAATLALVDERIAEEGMRSAERTQELCALTAACAAYEAVMFPLTQ